MTGVSTTAVQRLRRDAARLAKDPVPYVVAVPLASNILEWHYVVQGPSDSPYFGGYYHGKLVFPAEYPFKPPSIYMLTPNGRFQVNTRLCLSISDFHPDTWNPAWSVATILTGLLSFMLENTATYGSVETSDYEKRAYARASLTYNLKSKTFRDLFPDFCQKPQIDAETVVVDQKNTDQPKTDNDNVRRRHTAGNADRLLEDQDVNNDGHAAGAGGVLNASAVSNLLVFVGIIAFVFIAKYVLQSTE
jgi:ubiquitin-conjugating enzyme E2 J2